MEGSPSPVFQQAAFDALGIDATYEAIRAREGELADACRRLRREKLAGFNVTVPHKEKILSFLDRVDPEAERIGAVNTVVSDARGLQWTGYNTDAGGFVDSVGDLELAGMTVLIVGTGGAARAVSAGLGGAGCDVVVAGRRLQAARSVGELGGGRGGRMDSESTREVLRTCGLLVGTLPPDAWHDVAHALEPPRRAVVVDVAYGRSGTTPLVAWARKHGLGARDGTEMLFRQGARAFELWTGRPMPAEPARKALYEALDTPAAERKV